MTYNTEKYQRYNRFTDIARGEAGLDQVRSNLCGNGSGSLAQQHRVRHTPVPNTQPHDDPAFQTDSIENKYLAANCAPDADSADDNDDDSCRRLFAQIDSSLFFSFQARNGNVTRRSTQIPADRVVTKRNYTKRSWRFEEIPS
jgi:hypothetical protein